MDEDRNGDQRLGCGGKPPDEHGPDAERYREQRQHRGRKPRIAPAAEIKRQHKRHASRDDCERAEHVEPVWTLVPGKPAQQRRRHREREEAERDVEPKDDRPMQLFRDEPAQRRAAGACRRIDHSEIGIVAAAVLGRGSIAQDDHRDRREAGATDPLQGASDDEHAN